MPATELPRGLALPDTDSPGGKGGRTTACVTH